jgi:two-component system response regulator DegU
MLPFYTLLVDDSPDFLQSASRFLAKQPQIDIIGQATSGREALEQVARLRPHLVLMDLSMPEMSGLEATRHLKSQPNAPLVVILTLHDTPEYRAAAEAVQADGFVAKSEFGVKLLPLIESLYERPAAHAGQGGSDG